MFKKFSFIFFALFFVLTNFKSSPLEAQKYFITSSDKHKFVWFRVAKTGTRTTYHILLDHVKDLDHNVKGVKFNAKKHKNYFKFSFVRNPWARVVSCYFNKAQNHDAYQECWGKDFDYFVDFIDRQDLHTSDRHIRLQTELIPVNKLDFIGRLENFANDLKFAMDKIGVKDYVLEHRNSTDHKHYSTYYTERTKKIIARKYRKDIETFNYKFETKK